MAGESILFRMEDAGSEAPRLRLRALEGEEAVPDSRAAERYERVGEIARGGVGVVHKARDVDLGRDVAVKVLRDCHLDSPEIVQRFVEEAQIGGQLQHPGIVPVYELGLEGDRRPFFAMKLVKGETLASVLGGRGGVADDRRRILAIFGAACRTVAYAHSRGVVHRDLKPANVMIGAFGEVQVVDWGFAKVLAAGGVADERRSRRSRVDVTRVQTVRTGDEGSGSIAGSVFGTPAYMPPEQALGHVEELDERSDVFALGAILCEFLTGEPPYTGDSGEAIRKALRCDLADAESRLSACEADAELVTLCRKALSPVPKDRPRNAEVVSEAIAAHLAAADERAHRSRVTAIEERERASRARRQADESKAAAEDQRRRRRRTTGLAVAVVLLLLTGGGVWLGLEGARRDRRQRVAAAVEEAMREASRLRGSGDLAGAAAAAERARDLADADEAPDDLREEAGDLLVTARAEHAAADAAAVRIAEDEAFVAELAEIRLRRNEEWGAGQTDDRYAQSFREHGIDVLVLPIGEAAARIRTRTRPEEIAAALDDWAGLCLRDEDLPSARAFRLLEVTKIVDPDEWRNRLRDAMLHADVQVFHALAAEADPASLPPRTLSMLGSCLAEQDAGAGIEFISRARFHHPGDLWLNFQLAVHLGRTDPPRYEESIRYHTAALALSPRGTRVWAGLATCLMLAGELEEALLVFERARDLQLVLPRMLTNHGVTLVRLGRVDEGIELYRRAIQLDPDRWEAHGNLARALRSKEEFALAEESFRAVLRLRPDDPRALNGLALTLWQQGKEEDALAALRKAIVADQNLVGSYVNLCALLQRRGDFDGAIAAARRAIELDESCFTAHDSLGKLHWRGEEFEKAVAAFRRAAELQPGNARIRRSLATCLHNVGDDEGAIREAREALRLGLSHSRLDLALYLANARDENLRDSAEALTHARRCAEEFPELPWVRVILGIALYRSGEYESARNHLTDSRKTLEERLRVFTELFLAMALHRTGEEEEARRVLAEAEAWYAEHDREGDEGSRREAKALILRGGK